MNVQLFYIYDAMIYNIVTNERGSTGELFVKEKFTFWIKKCIGTTTCSQQV